jgi:transcription antitermination factor NusB
LAREKVLQVFAAATAAQLPWTAVFDHIFYRDFTADVPPVERPLLTPEEVQEVEADTPIVWDSAEVEFARRLLQAAEQYRELSTELLRRVLQHWDVERLVPIDRLILQLGIAEILAFPQTPVPVIIDAAVELAKRYSTEQSGQFVNGVLEAAYYRMVHEGLRAPSPEMSPRSAEEMLRPPEIPEGYNTVALRSAVGTSDSPLEES